MTQRPNSPHPSPPHKPFNPIVKCLLTPLAYILVHCFFRGGCVRGQHQRRPRSYPRKVTIPKKPKPRRALSISLHSKLYPSQSQDGGKAPERQVQSRLMGLPFEIREMIWQRILCGGFLSLDIDDETGRLAQVNSWYPLCLKKKKGLLNIALTCRQLYTETIPMLYSGNTLLTPSHTILHLPRLIPPPRLSAITHLWITWESASSPFPGAEEHASWMKFWAQIAELTALRKLCVDIHANSVQWVPIWADRESGLLTTVEQVDSTILHLQILMIRVLGKWGAPQYLFLPWRGTYGFEDEGVEYQAK